MGFHTTVERKISLFQNLFKSHFKLTTMEVLHKHILIWKNDPEKRFYPFIGDIKKKLQSLRSYNKTEEFLKKISEIASAL